MEIRDDKRFQKLLTIMKDGYYEMDLQGKFLFFNDALCTILGYSHTELKGTYFKEWMGEETARNFSVVLEKVYQTGVSETWRWEYQNRDGRMQFLEIHVYQAHDGQGQPVGYCGILRDQTDVKQLEKRLRESKERYDSLIEHNSDAVFFIDLKGYLFDVNPVCEKVTGYPVEELLHKPIQQFLVPETLNPIFRDWKQLKHGHSQNCEIAVVHKHGHTIQLSVKSIPIVINGNMVGICAIAKDITERKRTDEFLRKSDKLSIVGQLAAGVAHEIRNPLTAVKGFIQLLEHQIQHKKEYFDIMLSELGRIELIISEFLMLAKPQVIHYQQQDIRVLLHKVIILLETQAILNNVQIFTEYLSDIPLIMCEENQMKQVFINIIKNGIEAMPYGGKLIILVRMLDGDHVHIQFIDQGHGIAEDRIKKLGEPFYTTKEKGTGLGLMISYKIIEAHHGKIRFRSQVNRGTTVDIILPVSMKVPV